MSLFRRDKRDKRDKRVTLPRLAGLMQRVYAGDTKYKSASRSTNVHEKALKRVDQIGHLTDPFGISMTVTAVTVIRIGTLCALSAAVCYRTTTDAAIASVYACKRTRNKEEKKKSG